MNDDSFDDTVATPMDMLTAYFEACGWTHERLSEEEIVATAQGSWSSYELRGIWRTEDRVLQLLVFPDIRVAKDKHPTVHETLALINEQVWLGHFEIWSASGAVLYRHGCVIGGEGALLLESVETLITAAIKECDRFYPVFQFVLWADKSPREAMAAAMIETSGEA